MPISVGLDDILKKPYLLVEPPNEKILKWWSSPSRFKAITGGNRSGKTENVAIEVIWHLMGEHPYIEVPQPPVSWRVHVVSYQQLQRVVHEKFRKYLPPEALYKQDWKYAWLERSHILRLANGSTVDFTTHRHSIMHLEGASLHGVWIDEECPYLQYRALRFRLLDTGGKMFVSATPINGISWIEEFFKRFYEGDKDYYAETIATTENKFLSEDTIQKIIETTTPEEMAIRIYGQMLNISRRVFFGFSEDNIIRETIYPPPSSKWVVGLDWGLEHNSALVLMAYYGGKIFVVDEFMGRGLTLMQLSRRIAEMLDKYGIRHSDATIVYDAALNSRDSMNRQPISILKADGWRLVPSTKSLDLSLSICNDLFQNRLMFIYDGCQNLIEALQSFYFTSSSYAFEKAQQKDITDALRYGVFYMYNHPDSHDDLEYEDNEYNSAVIKIMLRRERRLNKSKPQGRYL